MLVECCHSRPPPRARTLVHREYVRLLEGALRSERLLEIMEVGDLSGCGGTGALGKCPGLDQGKRQLTWKRVIARPWNVDSLCTARWEGGRDSMHRAWARLHADPPWCPGAGRTTWWCSSCSTNCEAGLGGCIGLRGACVRLLLSYLLNGVCVRISDRHPVSHSLEVTRRAVGSQTWHSMDNVCISQPQAAHRFDMKNVVFVCSGERGKAFRTPGHIARTQHLL